ncbi:hypothetical protein H6P81_015928 [Aristolochia fimbriata]|uniref:Uncharacterized protein n=1 Tax=Aristolochia fimbriata TaxID=158543 RepID=A0AAV7EBH7_ARIFI|nr:hypothetical protein H6P81_015928 [Aristolochia fimbriata]
MGVVDPSNEIGLPDSVSKCKLKGKGSDLEANSIELGVKSMDEAMNSMGEGSGSVGEGSGSVREGSDSAKEGDLAWARSGDASDMSESAEEGELTWARSKDTRGETHLNDVYDTTRLAHTGSPHGTCPPQRRHKYGLYFLDDPIAPSCFLTCSNSFEA